MSKSVFAIRAEDALSWHGASKTLAGIAERSGFKVRAIDRHWFVWATDSDFVAICEQADVPL